MNVLKRNLINIHRFNQNTLYSTIYKSAISLETLYPGSSLKLSTPTKPIESMHEKFSGYIPIKKLEITYSRSPGPGGQNVNKVNTKVDLRFHLESAEWLQDDIKKKLAEMNKNKLTKEGYLVFHSDLTRSQAMNTADCLEKLRNAIRRALYVQPPPSEESIEKIRKRKEKAARERLMVKRERSFVKQGRQNVDV
nr:peptidyl-tRNA hydrolase ICT1, mitochondrial [Onthophagus taurus]